MISEEHKKHSELVKPKYGNYGRNEWAILGSNCNAIKSLADQVIQSLSTLYKCAYVDAKHPDEKDESSMPEPLAKGAMMEYTDHIQYHQFSYRETLDTFKSRQIFASADLVLVNGNHHAAKSQVIILDPSKKSSLQKRLSQLSNVQLILFTDDAREPFDFIKESIPAWRQLPLYHLQDTDKIISFFNAQMKKTEPLLNGLVLTGGKSLRMGFDKSLIDWHGKEQGYYMADQLKNFCKEVFISCRSEQQNEIDPNYLSLTDRFIGLGPYGAILSAFLENPDCAWLVTACDLPLLDKATLQFLTENRDCSAVATTFQSPYDDGPEPLVTIWEPKSYPVLLFFLSQGYSCPRKALRNNDVKILRAIDPDALINVNTPQDADKVRNILKRKVAG